VKDEIDDFIDAILEIEWPMTEEEAGMMAAATISAICDPNAITAAALIDASVLIFCCGNETKAVTERFVATRVALERALGCKCVTDSTTITARGTYYDVPLEVIDMIRPDALEQYIAETDAAPPADDTQDADIDAMSVEQIEAEIATRIMYWVTW
jgi:hypothetical protein